MHVSVPSVNILPVWTRNRVIVKNVEFAGKSTVQALLSTETERPIWTIEGCSVLNCSKDTEPKCCL